MLSVYLKNEILKDVRFVLTENTLLLGESGSGKTSILKCLANLMPYAGFSNGEIVSLAFQESNLIPDKTVYKNLSLVGKPINLLDIEHLYNKYPHQLSGGEAQRVNLTRALIYEPAEFVLFDEPTQGIDQIRLRELLPKIFNYLKANGKLALCVTHEVQHMYPFFQAAMVIKEGKLVQFSKLKNLYENPINDYVAKFFGEYSIINNKFIRPNWVGYSNSGLKVEVKSITFMGSYYRHELLIKDNQTLITYQNSDCYNNYVTFHSIDWGSNSSGY